MIGFPFDSHVTFESDGTPVYDRAITSAPLRKLIAKLLTDGVLPNPSTNLQVEAGSGMNVVVNPGFAICAGGLKLEENQRTLAIQAADSNYDRIDTVVLRWNDNDSERICDLYIVEGIPAASPLRPKLTRTESIWELGLADLFVNKNSSAISNQRITDTRYETARCGIISAISEFDTTTLYQQVQADLARFKASEQADFITWFNDIKGQLSEDAAGNLQKQIGTLESLKTEVKTNLVNALNWVVDKTSGVIAKLGSADISKIGDGTVTGAIVNNKEAIEDVTQSLTINNVNFNLDYQNGKYGWNESSERGADTFHPFKSAEYDLLYTYGGEPLQGSLNIKIDKTKYDYIVVGLGYSTGEHKYCGYSKFPCEVGTYYAHSCMESTAYTYASTRQVNITDNAIITADTGYAGSNNHNQGCAPVLVIYGHIK